MIFPEELRNTRETEFIRTNRRRSFDLSVILAQALNKKLQLAVSTDLVFQNGLLSTPFHRVYFSLAELPKIEKLLTTRFKFPVYPFYRYHTQTASRYFKPFKEHLLEQAYYTSDYDLSGFDSHKVGLGLRFAPVWGIGRFKLFSKKKITRFKSIDIRYAHYSRSDGLNASVISGGFGFATK